MNLQGGVYGDRHAVRTGRLSRAEATAGRVDGRAIAPRTGASVARRTATRKIGGDTLTTTATRPLGTIPTPRPVDRTRIATTLCLIQ